MIPQRLLASMALALGLPGAAPPPGPVTPVGAAIGASSAVMGGPMARLSPWHELTRLLSELWTLQLTSVNGHPITVSKIMIGLVVLVLGTIAARIASRQLGRRILPRFHLERGAAATLQTLTYYIFLALSLLMAMEAADLPLTTLTMIGGAVALGIGFGSQNIISNFISGLILLIERPISVLDVVEIAGQAGMVSRIGARSTRIRTFAGVDLIVPNSVLLEQILTCWVISDGSAWLAITITLPDLVPPARMQELLLKAAHDLPETLANPVPTALVMGFGDHTIQYRLAIAVAHEQLGDRFRLESELRIKVDGRMRERSLVAPQPPPPGPASVPPTAGPAPAPAVSPAV